MCGIVGLYGPWDASVADDLARMSAAVAHRGPDDRGAWSDPERGVALGHRRLSIVDVTDAGHQPMVSADGRWVLVLNGEVYDHDDHRRFLAGRGVAFRGHSDTEVLLELIAAVGLDAALARVEGMFALAVWDRHDGVLSLARDRVGEKPLYVGRVGGRWAFASELWAWRELTHGSAEPDPTAIAAYLRLGFVPAPLSILRGVRKLPAATIARLDADGGHQEGRYWSLRDVAEAGLASQLDLPDTDLVDLAEDVLGASVRRRRVADVPLGAFLSGGLDSSLVVALAQAGRQDRLRTFTVAVGGVGDESSAAAAVAAHLGTDHTTLPLPEVDAVAMADLVPRLYDEPFADPSAVPVALLCEATRTQVTVALSGDGADELLAGYNRYSLAGGGLARAMALPRSLRRGAASALRAVRPAAWDRLGHLLPGGLPALGTKVHKVAGVLGASDPLDAYHSLVVQWDPQEVMARPVSGLPRPAALAGGSPLDSMLLADQLVTLPDNMLVKVDRASMASGLEVRVPFLDHRFVEFTWRLPERAKVRDGQGKWLVRQLLARHVPRELWERPKMGFDPPLADWLRGPLRPWAQDLLAPDKLRRQGVLRPEPIARALAEHVAGTRNHDYALWTVLMLVSWLDQNKD